METRMGSAYTRPMQALVACVFVCAYVAAAEPLVVPEPEPAFSPRPRVGLALSGGGAKGGAHAGVLQVLEELRVPIDCIAGTSVGAFAGAGYAAGLSADEILEFLLGVDWAALVSGNQHREHAPIERKRARGRPSQTIEFGLRARRLVMPSGLVPTADMDDMLRSFVALARATTDFDRLPIPFRAVATDMISGEMVVLDSGDLATAIRGSMAVPGLMSPVQTEDHVLADGGMVRNLPVDVARELCADVVIAVTVMEATPPREQLETAGQLAARGMILMIDANTRAQQRTLTARDIDIEVATGVITTIDFEHVHETVPLGIEAARAVAHRLEELSLSPEDYAAWRAKISRRHLPAARLAEVRYEGLRRVNPEYLAPRATLKAGDEVSISRISREAMRLSALGDFESVEYRLEGDPAAPVLIWLPHENHWGPDYFRADVGLQATRGEIPSFVLHGQHTRAWINSRGGEWRNKGQLGLENALVTSFYQPLDVAQVLFLEPVLAYVVNWEHYYLEGEREATYRLIDLDAGVDLGVNLGREAQARIGYGRTSRRFDRISGTAVLPRQDARDAVLWVGFHFDSRDSPMLPTRGYIANLSFQWSDADIGSNRDWRRAELDLGTAVPFSGQLLWLGIEAVSDFDSELPLDRAIAIGGPASFPGLLLNELRVPAYLSLHITYFKRVRNLLPLFDQAIYAGIRLQGGWFEDRYALFGDERVHSLAVFGTRKTPAGPLTVGLAATTESTGLLWIAFGRTVDTQSVMGRGAFR
jgi:NTE family protein